MLTPYDQDHGSHICGILDASAQGADWTEAARIVLGMDPEQEPQRGGPSGKATWNAPNG